MTLRRGLLRAAGNGAALPQAAFLVINCPINEGSGSSLANNGLWSDGVMENHTWGTSTNIGTSLTPAGASACRTRVAKEASTPLPITGAITVDLDGTDQGAFFAIGSFALSDLAAGGALILGVGGTSMLNSGNDIEGLTDAVAFENTNIAIGTGARRVGFAIGTDKIARLFVDGVFVGSHTFNVSLNPSVGDSIKFGGYFDSARNSTAPFNKVRFWNGVKLTDAEMAQEALI